MATEGNVLLADGRVMTFAEFGAPEGHPVLYFHGTPSSRLEPLLIGDAEFSRLGLRIIAPDRPGMGRSSFQRHRSFSDWPIDVAALADALGIGKFSVLGNSGGGIYAVACAARIPERLHSVAIVSGAWRMDDPRTLAAMPFVNRLTWTLARRAPLLLSLWLRSVGTGVNGDLSQLKRHLPPADYEAFESPGRYEAFGYALRESLRQGTKGPAWDMRMYVHPLGIRLQDIQMSLHVFHGAKDVNVPIALIREALTSLPTALLTVYPRDAHLSTLCNHFDAIARTLVEG
ncbi:alpha/beta fold hydrolase [Dyella psychrodurans]|uniref:Alpha/beta hydrolase n=1 Tax=Dyella psychrodurans TaxID=1927960 RepID=A0A370WW27_9GAMM|nr:alpha/beta hydrolase [Dyella psychrodurans]RDS80358.1 alpha/beta hydrolase [Dyella psychrodurans]